MYVDENDPTIAKLNALFPDLEDDSDPLVRDDTTRRLDDLFPARIPTDKQVGVDPTVAKLDRIFGVSVEDDGGDNQGVSVEPLNGPDATRLGGVR